MRAHSAASPRQNAAAVSLNEARILVVDDEKDLRELMEGLLEDLGAKVTSADSAAEGLKALAENSFDLVISDVQMPEVDGFEFGRLIKAAGIRVKLVYLSGYSVSARHGLIAAQIGACDYLEKPFDEKVLGFFIQQAIDSGRYVVDQHNAAPNLDDDQIYSLIAFLKADADSKLALRISKDLERLLKKRNKKALPGYLKIAGPDIQVAIKSVIERIVDGAF